MAKFPAGIDAVNAEVWLTSHGTSQDVAAALLPVLGEMWQSALEAGVQAGSESAGVQAQVSAQEYQDLLAQLQRQWLPQIVSTTVTMVAGALAGAASLTAKTLAAAVAAALADLSRARQIAITEITRAMALMAQRIYHSAGHLHVRWQTDPLATTPICQLCLDNEAAGPWPLGVPFPSGAPYPPQHPGCRCAIVPA